MDCDALLNGRWDASGGREFPRSLLLDVACSDNRDAWRMWGYMSVHEAGRAMLQIDLRIMRRNQYAAWGKERVEDLAWFGVSDTLPGNRLYRIESRRPSLTKAMPPISSSTENLIAAPIS